jgi:Cu-Zn family superoxide dismutase
MQTFRLNGVAGGVALATAAFLLGGCGAMQNMAGGSSDAPPLRATAQLMPTQGNATAGTVRFVQKSTDVVTVSGEVSGLLPNAVHGFHIHEKGDCSSGDGMSAGGHFNPTGQPHGRSDAASHHVGDLMSLQADANGVARFSVDSQVVRLGSGDLRSVIGKGLIVHRDPDDFTTQPTGNSGPRMACGVIAAG